MSTSPEPWTTYNSYRSTLKDQQLNTLTDVVDSVFRLKDAQLAQLKGQVQDLQSPQQAELYSQIPLPYDAILYSNVDVFLNADDTTDASIAMFLSSSPFNDIVDPKAIAGPMAQVIFWKITNALANWVTGLRDSKCYEQHAVFLTAGKNGKAVRLDIHTTSFRVQDPDLQLICGSTVTVLSQIISSTEPDFITKNVSSIVDQLYPTESGVTRKGQKQIITFITGTVNHASTSALARRQLRFPQASETAVAAQRQAVQEERFKVLDQDFGSQVFTFTLPMGTAAAARQPVEAWMQSSIQTQAGPKSDTVFDCVCTQTGEVGSTLQLQVTASGKEALTEEDWEKFGGFFDFVKSAALNLLVYSADYVIKTFAQG